MNRGFKYLIIGALCFGAIEPCSGQLFRSSEKRQASRSFELHTINKGETAYAISKRYGVTVTELADDNPGVDITHLPLGAELRIRRQSMGKTGNAAIDKSMEHLQNSLNDSSSLYTYHVVEKGETIYSVTHKFNTTEDQLGKDNDLSAGLKAGAIVRIQKIAAQPAINQQIAIEQPKQMPNASVRQIASGQRINIAMMLPLDGSNARGFNEFYQGALVGLEDLKAQGYSAELNLYSVDRSAANARNVLEDNSLRSMNLIIGPIYEEALEPVVEFAAREGIAVISPLLAVDKIESSVLYVMPPTPQSKYDKLRDIVLSSDQNVVVVNCAETDSEFKSEVERILPSAYRTFNYVQGIAPSEIENIISGQQENIFFVVGSNETSIEQFLARLSSIQSNLIARSIKNPIIKIVGTSRWQRFTNIDKNLFFKLNLCFVTNYTADRNNPKVGGFDRRYVAAFSTLPSLFSYRGYDAVRLFVPAEVGKSDSFTYKVNTLDPTPLQTPYLFAQIGGKSYVNDQWALVIYHDNYTIEVK